MRALPLWSQVNFFTSSKAFSPNAVTLGVRVSTYGGMEADPEEDKGTGQKTPVLPPTLPGEEEHYPWLLCQQQPLPQHQSGQEFPTLGERVSWLRQGAKHKGTDSPITPGSMTSRAFASAAITLALPCQHQKSKTARVEPNQASGCMPQRLTVRY